MNAMGEVYWKDYVKNLSPEAKRWVLDSTSIYLGMDYNHIDAYLMLDLLRHNETSKLLDPKYAFYSFNGAMNLTFFNVWVEHLKNEGVSVYLNHEIQSINMDGDKIISINILNKMTNDSETKTGDIFVNGLPTESLAHLIKRDSFIKLARLGHQIQTQVLYYLDFRIPQDKNTAYIFSDSPWFLMARHEGSFWDLQNYDLLSCGIGIMDVPGLNGKMAIECTREELAQECWDQMTQYPPENFPKKLPEWNIWKSFKFTLLGTHEPKFSNNKGTLQLRPNSKDDEIVNLYHATSYTRTNVNIFNMESGVEAGVRVAAKLGGKEAVIPCSKPSFLLRCLRKIDKVWFRIQKSFRCISADDVV